MAHVADSWLLYSVILTAAAESPLQKLKCNVGHRTSVSKRKSPVVVSHIHKLVHYVKNAASRDGVPLLPSPCKVASLCPEILKGPAKTPLCQTKHARPFASCAMAVVYLTPLACGKVYIGQMARCLNDHLREHQLICKTGSHLSHHCVVLSSSQEQVAHELIATFFPSKNRTTPPTLRVNIA